MKNLLFRDEIKIQSMVKKKNAALNLIKIKLISMPEIVMLQKSSLLSSKNYCSRIVYIIISVITSYQKITRLLVCKKSKIHIKNDEKSNIEKTVRVQTP